MKICVAQIQPHKGNISINIAKHTKFIEIASTQLTSAIFFPELSITGYEPQLAKELATTQDDTNFDVFQQLSDNHNLTIGIGAPTLGGEGILISMILFQPHALRQTYSKQQLHSDELPYFVPGKKQVIITVENIKIAPGICYESLQSAHSAYACKLGAQVYIASVAKTQNGIEKAIVHYPEVANINSMPVFMANSVGLCDNFKCVGKSSIWNKQGMLVGQLDEAREGFLVFDTDTEEVCEKYIL